MVLFLNDDNFLAYAKANYENFGMVDEEEFEEDLKRIAYLKRLFSRFHDSKELKERLILNHIIVMNNLFGAGPTSRMLFFKLQGHWADLKPFLVYLNILPDQIEPFDPFNHGLNTSTIMMNPQVIKRLRSI